MRVVVVSAWPPWLAGHGGMLVLHHHLRLLAPRHQITLLAAGAPDRETPVPAEAAADLSGLQTEWFGTPLPAALDHLARRTHGVVAGEPAHVFWVERPDLMAALRRELAYGADLVWAFGWGTARLHEMAAPIPVVHTAVDSWQLGRLDRRMPAWRHLADIGEASAVIDHERRHYPKLAAVTVVADTDAEQLRRVAPTAHIEVIPNGVDLGPPPAPIVTDPPVLGCHGNFASAHNVEAAVTLATGVLPLVRRAVPAARVLLAGMNPPAEVTRLGGIDGVELVIDPAAMRPVLDRVTVGVALDDASGLKNKVLETMAAGRPVVASSPGIISGGGLILAGDPDEAAAEVIRLIGDPTELAAAGRAARDRVASEFSWPASAARLEAIWQRAAAVNASRQ